MSQPAKTPEPTMEDILASIRRIIADDDDTTTKAGPVLAKEVAVPATAGPPSPAPRPTSAPVVAAVPMPGEPAGSADRDRAETDAEVTAFDAEMHDASDESSDVLELTESMRANTPTYHAIGGAPDVVFSEPEFDEPPPDRVPVEMLRAVTSPPDRQLLSPRTAAAVDSAFNSLAHTVLVQNARTLEDLVREMLKPMLKTWLDDNLPKMVERLVRAEIERVSRGRE
jgi:cell pole-organizing protein PopZ